MPVEELTAIEVLNRARVLLALSNAHSYGSTQSCLADHALNELDRLAEMLTTPPMTQGESPCTPRPTAEMPSCPSRPPPPRLLSPKDIARMFRFTVRAACRQIMPQSTESSKSSV